jgi:hypothetical protein
VAQFYLLSIIANVIAGLTLSSDYLGERVSFFAGFKRLRENRSTEITLGLVTAIIGIFKLIIKSPGEGVPVVGDLLPALAGIALGLILLGEAFRKKVEATSESIEKASRTVLTYRVPVGIAGAVIALLHFFIPSVLIL